MLRTIAKQKLAERVGVLAHVFKNSNICSGFRLISRNCNDLASSNRCQRFRPFAGVCRFFYFNDTRRDGWEAELRSCRSAFSLKSRSK